MPKSEMLSWIFGSEERDLNDRDVQRVSFLVEGDFEAGPDTVVETAAHTVRLDACCAQGVNDFLCYFWGALVRICLLVIICWEAVEAATVLELEIYPASRGKSMCTHRLVPCSRTC